MSCSAIRNKKEVNKKKDPLLKLKPQQQMNQALFPLFQKEQNKQKKTNLNYRRLR